MRRIALLVAVQAVLVLLWLGVERGRRPVATFAFERLDEPAPTDLGDGVVHFWATWCGPCVTELPALIAAAEAEGVPLVAVTDEPWPVVERFFDGDVPAPIVRDEAAARTWQVSGLPDTFVVADGRVVARVGGPRDWTTPEARAFLRGFDGP